MNSIFIEKAIALYDKIVKSLKQQIGTYELIQNGEHIVRKNILEAQ